MRDTPISRAGDRRRRDRRGHDRPAAGRRDHVRRLPRGLLGPDRQRVAKFRYMTGGQVDAAAGHPLGQRRRHRLRRPALAGGGELGAAVPGPEDRRPRDARRRQRAAGGGDPRPRPRALPRAQGASTAIKGEVPRGRAVRPPLGEAERASAQGSDVTIVSLGCMVPRALEAAEQLAGEGSTSRSSTCARSCRSTSQTVLDDVARTGCLFTVEENPRLWAGGPRSPRSSPRRRSSTSTERRRRITTPHIPLAVRRLPRGRSHAGGGPDRRDRAQAVRGVT